MYYKFDETNLISKSQFLCTALYSDFKTMLISITRHTQGTTEHHSDINKQLFLLALYFSVGPVQGCTDGDLSVTKLEVC